MKIQTLLAITLLWVSGQVSAVPIDYSFSGEMICETPDPICGAYTGMITIDDAQIGTAIGVSDGYRYAFDDLMIILADGAELTSTSGLFTSITTPIIQETNLGINGVGDISGVYLFWQTEIGAYDTSDITEVLTALTSDTLLTRSSVNFYTATDYPCIDLCRGTLTKLTEKTADVPEPTIIALLSLGLVGIGFTRRKVRS